MFVFEHVGKKKGKDDMTTSARNDVVVNLNEADWARHSPDTPENSSCETTAITGQFFQFDCSLYNLLYILFVFLDYPTVAVDGSVKSIHTRKGFKL